MPLNKSLKWIIFKLKNKKKTVKTVKLLIHVLK